MAGKLFLVQIDDHALVGEPGGREDRLGFQQQWRIVEVALGEVPQDKVAHIGLTGHGSGFKGGAVVALVGFQAQAVVVGGLMVQPVHALYTLDHAAREFGVAAIGVADGIVGCGGQLVVGNDKALGGDPILALTQRVHRIVGHAQPFDFLADDVTQFRLLPEQEAQSVCPATRLANEGLVIDLNQK